MPTRLLAVLACVGMVHGLALRKQKQYDSAVPQGIIDPTEAAVNAAADALPAKLWPLPQNANFGDKTLGVSPTEDFFTLGGAKKSDFLSQAFARYQQHTFLHSANNASQAGTGSLVTGLELTVDDLDDSHPQLETDEAYTLSVPATSGKAKATAKTVYGALRALETFSQLVHFDFDSNSYALPGAPWTIEDAPRFPHRGLMIDTARHYQPLTSIRAIIDSLPYAKLNVLHWHMVDTQSFPFEVVSHPKLWNAAHLPSQRYTQADVAGIVEYARMRGVRVMVEFDVPGHAESWCEGEPAMCLESGCATDGAATQPLNVANHKTWEVISDLLTEVTGDKASVRGKPSGLFPDNFVHLGGDEVATNCWDADPVMGAFKTENGLVDGEDLYSYFVSKAGKIAQQKGRRPVQWAEAWGSAHTRVKLHKDSIVHVWQSTTNVADVVADGFDVIINVGYFEHSWYLDNLEVGWKDVYNNDPCGAVSDDGCKKILGGHGQMWGETVDGSNLMHTVWPRLGSIAEKLWSSRDATALENGVVADSTIARFKDFRCMLLERGVGAAPQTQPFARSAPEGPGSCEQ